MNSAVHQLEQLRFGKRIRETNVSAPLFILGHYRSGTTHLHNLLSQDSRFAAPTFFQTIFPQTFLTTEAASVRIGNFFLPKTRPFDNVHQHLGMAQEDEFSMCSINGLSPYMSWTFPQRMDYYDRFLSFREATESERNRWLHDLRWLLQKLTLKHQRPLLLKSPPHTARVRLLLHLFPDARFVHIHRDPYAVYQSMVKITDVGRKIVRLQTGNKFDWEERVFRHYIEMHDAYFDDEAKIPSGNSCLVRFEELERDPLGELRRIYESLNLPDFKECERSVAAYVASIKGYQRNKFRDLSSDQRGKVYNRWQRTYDEWGYASGITIG